jgi:hypothetical protein
MFRNDVLSHGIGNAINDSLSMSRGCGGGGAERKIKFDPGSCVGCIGPQSTLHPPA